MPEPETAWALRDLLVWAVSSMSNLCSEAKKGSLRSPQTAIVSIKMYCRFAIKIVEEAKRFGVALWALDPHRELVSMVRDCFDLAREMKDRGSPPQVRLKWVHTYRELKRLLECMEGG